MNYTASDRKLYRSELKEEVFTESELLLIRAGPFETQETTIRAAYFGKDRNLESGPSSQLGLHLVVSASIINGIQAVWGATYTRMEDIEGLLDDLNIGSSAWERQGVADVQSLAGVAVAAHYVKMNIYGNVLVGLSTLKE